MEKDKETKKVLSDAERIKQTLDTPGWGVISKRFFEYLNALDSVQNITETDPDKIAKLILVNKKVYDTLKIFWQDISGEAEIASENTQLMDDELENSHILYKE